MSREWKPGDVAIVRNEHGVWNRAICTVGLNGDTWRFGVALSEQPVDGSEAHPLAVIDVEDREQCQRLADAMSAHRAPGPNTFNVQAALRSLVTPPKPDEPLGLGAVVEDAEGVKWVRVALGRYGWVEANAMTQFDGDGFDGTLYADIAAVKIVSPGVTP